MSIEDFGKSNFADKRINKRYYEIMEELSKDPGSSFPQIMKDWSDLKGFYRFISNNKVTAKEILSPHISSTVERCFEEEVVLAVQDTTYLNYSTHKKAKGLGKISDKENLRGMIVHSVIGVGGKESKYLGVLSEEIIIRNGEKNKGNETKKERLGRKRESGKWIKD